MKHARAATTTAKRSRPAVVVSLVLLLTVVAGCLAVSGAGLSPRAAVEAARSAAGGAAAGAGKDEPTPSPSETLPAARGMSPGGQGGAASATGPFFGAQVAGAAPLADIRQDEGASIALPDGRTLYLFADTVHLHTQPPFFRSSTAAVAEPEAPLLLHYAQDAKGVPTEWLPREPDEKEDQVDGVRYTAVWPTGATTLPGGRIVISYGKYDLTMKPLVMRFRSAGLYEYTYDNAQGFAKGSVAHRFADDIWPEEIGAVGSPVYLDGFVYFTVCEDLECYSLRTTPSRLADRDSYEWRTWSGWSDDVDDRAPMLFGHSRPGFNPAISWVESLDAFVMADTPAGSAGPNGQVWVAAKPWGPWSVPATFGLPRCPSAGCYGLNVDAKASTKDSVRISYSPVGVNRVGPYVYLLDQPVRVRPTSNGRRVSIPE